jgi:hypothetical protein
VTSRVVFSVPGRVSRKELLRIQRDTGMKVSARQRNGRTILYGTFRRKKELAEALTKMGYGTS